MVTATKTKEVETSTGQTKKPSIEIRNDSIQKEIERLEPEAKMLLSDIYNRRNEIEHDLRGRQKKVEAEISGLREAYDRHIGDGEAQEGSAVLDKIKTLKIRLKTLAEQALKVSTDYSDLQSRQENLRLKVIALVQAAESNCKRAKELRDLAGNLLFAISDSANHEFIELGKESEKTRRVALSILSPKELSGLHKIY